MKTLYAGLLFVALVFSGCTTLQAVTGARISATQVVIAANAFDALEATASGYLRLRRCTPTSGPVCRSPAATAQIVPAIRSGRVARNNLEQYVKTHPEGAPQDLFAKLTLANDTLRSVYAVYGIR